MATSIAGSRRHRLVVLAARHRHVAPRHTQGAAKRAHPRLRGMCIASGLTPPLRSGPRGLALRKQPPHCCRDAAQGMPCTPPQRVSPPRSQCAQATVLLRHAFSSARKRMSVIVALEPPPDPAGASGVPESTPEYPRVPQSTTEYPRVPQSTPEYPRRKQPMPAVDLPTIALTAMLVERPAEYPVSTP